MMVEVWIVHLKTFMPFLPLWIGKLGVDFIWFDKKNNHVDDIIWLWPWERGSYGMPWVSISSEASFKDIDDLSRFWTQYFIDTREGDPFIEYQIDWQR
jgi:hypothetical protein